jgi:hypothetical protein
MLLPMLRGWPGGISVMLPDRVWRVMTARAPTTLAAISPRALWATSSARGSLMPYRPQRCQGDIPGSRDAQLRDLDAPLPGGRDRVPRQPPASKARLPTLARDRCSGGPEADLARRLGGRRPPVTRRAAAVGRAVARSLPRLPNLQHLARLLAGVLSHGFVGRRPDQADQVIGLEHEDPGHEPDQSSPVRRHLFLRGPSSRPTMAGPR